MPKTKTLSVRLLRAGRKAPDALTEAFSAGAERALQERPWDDIDGASLFFGQIYSNPPGWRAFLEQGSPGIPTEMFTGGAGAVIFLPVENRTLAICFGHISYRA
jgi:uncharacterized protein (TIGR04141 family)